MEYYLDYRGSVKSLGCAANGVQSVRTSMTFASSAPRRGNGLAEYVTGASTPATRGDIKLAVQIYAPTGGKLTGLSVNGKRAPVYPRADGGRKVYVLPMVLKPGDRATVDASFRSGPGQVGAPVLDWTPGMTWGPSGATAASACA